MTTLETKMKNRAVELDRKKLETIYKRYTKGGITNDMAKWIADKEGFDADYSVLDSGSQFEPRE